MGDNNSRLKQFLPQSFVATSDFSQTGIDCPRRWRVAITNRNNIIITVNHIPPKVIADELISSQVVAFSSRILNSLRIEPIANKRIEIPKTILTETPRT